MAANMHNQDDKHQSFHENDEQPYIEPAWVKRVKLASLIMGLMIVAGLVLLVYGLATKMGSYGERMLKTDRNFTYPETMRPVGATAGAEGMILLELEDKDGAKVLVHIDPASKKVISTTILSQGSVLGFED